MDNGNIESPGSRGEGDYSLDLNPDFLAGQNHGLTGPHPEKADGLKSAYDIKSLRSKLSDLNDTELKGIAVLPAGSRLEQGATYIDLRKSKPSEFTATAGMEAGRGNWYVPKTEIAYDLWNRITGQTHPDRPNPPAVRAEMPQPAAQDSQGGERARASREANIKQKAQTEQAPEMPPVREQFRPESMPYQPSGELF